MLLLWPLTGLTAVVEGWRWLQRSKPVGKKIENKSAAEMPFNEQAKVSHARERQRVREYKMKRERESEREREREREREIQKETESIMRVRVNLDLRERTFRCMWICFNVTTR
jgi:hypothetical protein